MPGFIPATPPAAYPLSIAVPDAVELHEAACANAMRAGYEIIRPEGNVLLVDLDVTPIDQFMERLNFLDGMVKVQRYELWPSKTAGHYHARVYLAETYPDRERTLMQSVLGSDYKRELLGLKGILHKDKNWSVLFRPPGAKVSCVTWGGFS